MDKIAYCALDKVNLGIIIVDRDINIIIWNSWLERLTGINRDQILGRNLIEVYPQFAQKSYPAILQAALFKGQSRFCSGAIHHTFIPPAEEGQKKVRQNMLVEPIYVGDERYALLQISDMTGHYTRVNQLKNMIKEIGMEYEQVRASEMMSRYQALHDSLTGLPNRNAFNDRLENSINIARRNGEMLAVMFVDLDGFKMVNDTYGHEAGDILLQSFAVRLKKYLRESDTLARLGGDEFMVLLPSIKSETDVAVVAAKISSAFAESFLIQGHELHLTGSIGISLFPRDGYDAPTLIRNADMAMYLVKSEGKNAFKFFQVEQEDSVTSLEGL